MRVLDRIGWETLHVPGLYIGFVQGSASLDPFLPRRAPTAGDLLDRGRERIAWTGADDVRAEVAAALADYGRRFEAPEAVQEAAAALARPGTVAIVTGQQPGLFGGPLYVWHKIATALRLARDLRALDDGPEVVTIFWNHSDDHDWGEANHSFLLNPALDVQRIRLRQPTTGRPLSAIPVGDDAGLAADEARDLLPATAAAASELALLRPRAASETLATLTSRLLFRHYGEDGLLILEPAALPPTLRAPLVRWHADAEELRAIQKATGAELVDRGYDVMVDPESPFLFCIEAGGKRRAVPDGETCPAPDLASPGVLLRNLWQDRLLPTLAYVAGPGEVSYLALATPLYDRFDVPRPPLVPRASMTHVDPRLAGWLERWDLALADLERGARVVEERIATRCGAGEADTAGDGAPEQELEELATELEARLRGLEPRVAEVDPNLCHPLARIGSRSASELHRFVQKLRNQRRSRAGRFRQHARRLTGELMPRGRLQERVFPALPYVARRGPGFASGLIDIADPFADVHLLIVDEPPDR